MPRPTQHAEPPPHRIATQRPTLGRLGNSPGNFRALALLLARDPLYGQVPLARLHQLDRCLASGRALAAQSEGTLVGACTWVRVPHDVARRAIVVGELPPSDLTGDEGEALLLTMIVGSRPGVVMALLRLVARLFAGHLILYERHQKSGRATQRFGWVDCRGVLGGTALEGDERAPR